jgi:hypothetical protein
MTITKLFGSNQSFAPAIAPANPPDSAILMIWTKS